MRTPHSRIAGNQRPAACSLGRGYTWTRVAEGAHCTWWRVIQQRPLECKPFCYGQEATSAPWAGSPCWTSCLLCRLWACPPFRFCTHPSAVDINNIQGYFSQCKFNYRIFIKVEKKNLVKLVFVLAWIRSKSWWMAESCVIDKMGKEERMHIVRSFSRVYQNDCGYVHKMAKRDFHFHCHVRCATYHQVWGKSISFFC